jgi:hypothetical protein
MPIEVMPDGARRAHSAHAVQFEEALKRSHKGSSVLKKGWPGRGTEQSRAHQGWGRIPVNRPASTSWMKSIRPRT